MNQLLPKGFITPEQAIDMINKDTRENPVVDVQFLFANLHYLQRKFNYTVPLLKRSADGKVVENGKLYIAGDLIDNYWLENLKHAIIEKFKEETRLRDVITDPERMGLRAISTTVSTEDQSGRGKMTALKTNAGENLNEGTSVETASK